ncbi:hypothetical protein HU200_016678 [Digitaria exilis]|uniref:Uncharacterized protein n=1 Tax=Digitaria exilis TaxID=1010633 RepID=A0A835F7N1_9POAL|nr:hypothetical protein HU200_016678 [Digitaria exilis]
MFPGKLALLVLLVFAVVFLHPVIGNKHKICTKIEKDNILKHCEDSCCAAALEVPNLDMQCIIDLLTADEKSRHNENNIMELSRLCNPFSRAPPKEVGRNLLCW